MRRWAALGVLLLAPMAIPSTGSLTLAGPDPVETVLYIHFPEKRNPCLSPVMPTEEARSDVDSLVMASALGGIHYQASTLTVEGTCELFGGDQTVYPGNGLAAPLTILGTEQRLVLHVSTQKPAEGVGGTAHGIRIEADYDFEVRPPRGPDRNIGATGEHTPGAIETSDTMVDPADEDKIHRINIPLTFDRPVLPGYPQSTASLLTIRQSSGSGGAAVGPYLIHSGPHRPSAVHLVTEPPGVTNAVGLWYEGTTLHFQWHFNSAFGPWDFERETLQVTVTHRPSGRVFEPAGADPFPIDYRRQYEERQYKAQLPFDGKFVPDGAYDLRAAVNLTGNRQTLEVQRSFTMTEGVPDLPSTPGAEPPPPGQTPVPGGILTVSDEPVGPSLAPQAFKVFGMVAASGAALGLAGAWFVPRRP